MANSSIDMLNAVAVADTVVMAVARSLGGRDGGLTERGRQRACRALIGVGEMLDAAVSASERAADDLIAETAARG